MSRSNPYELRFDMFQQAREILVDEYHAKTSELMARYELVEGAEYPTNLPEYPSFKTIVDMAKEINTYVSD
jgi:hypothetical protein